MITQQYFCDKCKMEIGEGQFMFAYSGFAMYRNSGGKQKSLNDHHRFKWDHDRLYCGECAQAFVNIHGD